MNDFEKYLKELADHEDEQSKAALDPRSRILVNAGVRLNWLGDYLANPKIQYKKIEVPTKQVLFTGTNPDWNKILIDKCARSVEKFQAMIAQDKEIKNKFIQEASDGQEPILMRGPDESGCYLVLDGMHRFVGAVLAGRGTVSAYAPINANEHLPVCEPHTVYDLIRGFQRHAQDKNGKIELYCALKLLARTYENVLGLLESRFNSSYVDDKDTQEIIEKVIKETRK